MDDGLRVALVSDYFYPKFGGVESHIIGLASGLLRLGLHVVVVTHTYGTSHVGKVDLHLTKLATISETETNDTIRLTVYYLPVGIVAMNSMFPSLFPTFRFFPMLFEKEKINLVHGHSSMSAMVHESIWHAKIMGLSTVITDHSLIGFADVGAIFCNKLLEGTLSDESTHVICVSYCSAANTILRSNIPTKLVHVIPNGVSAAFNAELFPPLEEREEIRVVICCRLEYRRGIDLLLSIIPKMCQEVPSVKFVIAGDGPYRVRIEEVIRRYYLSSRVELKGMVPHKDLPKLLSQCHIFLNTALTEAFCIAICEAARMGLSVVSSNVGGIPEVLDKDIVRLSNPSPTELYDSLLDAIKDVKSGDRMLRNFISKKAAGRYNWPDVCSRTIEVYRKSAKESRRTFRQRLRLFRKVEFAGFFYQAVLVVHTSLVFLKKIGISVDHVYLLLGILLPCYFASYIFANLFGFSSSPV